MTAWSRVRFAKVIASKRISVQRELRNLQASPLCGRPRHCHRLSESDACRSLLPLRLRPNRIEAPQPIVGQFGAAPPAMDRVAPAEILLVRDNRLAEFGQRQPASVVGGETVPQVFPADRTQLVVETGHGRNRSMRKPVQQIAVLPLIKDARPSQAAKVEKLSLIHIS